MQSEGAFERNGFKEAWVQLREEVTAQKDGKRRTNFIGVSSASETFVLVESSQTPAINHQKAMESGGLTTLKQACGLEDAFFVRLPDIPSDKTIVQDKKEPLELFPDELAPEWYQEILMTHHPGVWQSRLLRRLGSQYFETLAKLEQDRKNEEDEEKKRKRKNENIEMPSPAQKRQRAEDEAAEKAAQEAQAAQKAAQAAEQRKHHQEVWQKST